MTFIGILGALLGFAWLPLVFRRMTLGRFGLVVLLLLLHIAAAVAYLQYSKTNAADAYGYYYYGRIWALDSWYTPGSPFIAHLVGALRNDFGATYLDCFLLFQGFGAVGLLFLLRTFEEIYEKTQSKWASVPLLILFLPTLNFWTAAIGKDAPVFLGLSVATWSAMRLGRRAIPMAIALLIILMFRPHIALAVVIALTLATVMYGGFSLGKKVPLVLVALGAAAILVGTVRTSLNVDVTSASSLSGFFEDRAAVEASDKLGTSLGHAPYVVKLVSLLFRPLFIDAQNILGLLASPENVGSLLLFFFLVRKHRQVRAIAKQVFFVRFVLVLAVVLILLLALENYNVGLGLRQRLMAIPPLFSLFVVLWATRGVRTSASPDPQQLAPAQSVP